MDNTDIDQRMDWNFYQIYKLIFYHEWPGGGLLRTWTKLCDRQLVPLAEVFLKLSAVLAKSVEPMNIPSKSDIL